MTYGGIEAGGTKWVCAVADEGGEILASAKLPTTSPEQTLARVATFFRRHEAPPVIGVGSFGPLDIRPESATFGHITTTPKPGWENTDIVSPLREALGVRIVLDTDVNAAAFGEWRRGAGVGLDTFAYITVGTGIGGGAVVNGRLLHGLLHPELGHIRIPHDRQRDPFEGTCPYHGDCLEGLASGEAMRQRWGRPADELLDSTAWALEAEYLALGVVNVIHTLSPQRIIVGGGIAKHPGLLALVRARVREHTAGYLATPAMSDGRDPDEYIVWPGLGDLAGVLGAVELARTSARAEGSPAATC